MKKLILSLMVILSIAGCSAIDVSDTRGSVSIHYDYYPHYYRVNCWPYCYYSYQHYPHYYHHYRHYDRHYYDRHYHHNRNYDSNSHRRNSGNHDKYKRINRDKN